MIQLDPSEWQSKEDEEEEEGAKGERLAKLN